MKTFSHVYFLHVSIHPRIMSNLSVKTLNKKCQHSKQEHILLAYITKKTLGVMEITIFYTEKLICSQFSQVKRKSIFQVTVEHTFLTWIGEKIWLEFSTSCRKKKVVSKQNYSLIEKNRSLINTALFSYQHC